MSAPPRSALEADVLHAVSPSPDEERALQTDVAELLSLAQAALAKAGLTGRATLQGSVAKGTWLRGGADVDLFLLLDPALPAERLERAALEIGPALLSDPQRKYAQHPYLTGAFRGRTVDVVPAYAVASAGAKMSAVDRTPFHTAWVQQRLDDAARAQVRLLKAWMKGVGVYGAQTAVGGFSGYLVEVLVARFTSFAAVLDWLRSEAKPRRIALGPDQAKDDVAPLVVVDPVDPARNCAAAVAAPTLAAAIEAARAYHAGPDRRFFFPSPPRPESADLLRGRMASNAALWTGLLLKPQAERMDIVFPQFQRAARTLEGALRHAGFTLHRGDVTLSPREDEVLVQWVSGQALPSSRLHQGPRDDGRPNAADFRAKWAGHPDALGPVAVNAEGRLQVEVRIRDRTPAQWLRAHLPDQALGKHVLESLPGHAVLDDPAQAPAAWASRVADVVLDRRPWQR